jgi:hypothetical protein
MIRKVIGRRFIIEEHTIKVVDYKFCTKIRLDRTIYQALVLECGHVKRIESMADMKAKNVTCIDCLIKTMEEKGEFLDDVPPADQDGNEGR